MDKIQDREGIAKLPVTEWEDALQEFLAPVAAQAPDVRVRRLFILVLRAPLFVYHRGVTWPRDAIRWLRCLGGKRGLRIDRDGPDVLLAGIRAVFVTAATRAFAAHHPFPAGHTSLWVITRFGSLLMSSDSVTHKCPVKMSPGPTRP